MHGGTKFVSAQQLQYVMLIAFPLQQWLYERSSMLGYTYIACLVNTRIHMGLKR